MQTHPLHAQHQSMPRQVFQNQVVVFSKNYWPLARITIRRAVVLLVTGQAASLDLSSAGTGDRLLHDTGMILQTKPKAPMHPAIAFAAQFWKATTENPKGGRRSDPC